MLSLRRDAVLGCRFRNWSALARLRYLTLSSRRLRRRGSRRRRWSAFFEHGGFGSLPQAVLIDVEPKDDGKDADGNAAGPGQTGRAGEFIQPGCRSLGAVPIQCLKQPPANG